MVFRNGIVAEQAKYTTPHQKTQNCPQTNEPESKIPEINGIVCPLQSLPAIAQKESDYFKRQSKTSYEQMVSGSVKFNKSWNICKKYDKRSIPAKFPTSTLFRTFATFTRKIINVFLIYTFPVALAIMKISVLF